MIHDCDPGIDDAFALAVIAGLAEADLRGVVAVAGNVGSAATFSNATRLVELLGLSIPVGRGAESGLVDPYPPGAPHVHGIDGLGGGAALLPRFSSADEPVDGVSLLAGDVIATGPLTDVAIALRRGQGIDRIVWMGGSCAVGGNITPAAEFNAWCDPHAADEVLVSGIPLSMVPLDITMQVPLTRDDVERIGRGGKRAQPFAVAGEFLVRAHAQGTCAYMHDPVAVIAAYRPDLFCWEGRTVRCESTSEMTRGLTLVDRRPGQTGPVQVALDLDVDAVHDLLIDAVLRAVSDPPSARPGHGPGNASEEGNSAR